MTGIRDAYLQAAASAAALLDDPAVAAAWDAASALPEFSVAGLAGHLARQVVAVPRVLGQPVPAEQPTALLDHYARVPWVGAALDNEANVDIRRGGEDEAARRRGRAGGQDRGRGRRAAHGAACRARGPACASGLGVLDADPR